VCYGGGNLAAGREHLENSTAEVSPVGTWPFDLYRPLFEGDWDAARDMATATVDRWAAMGAIVVAIDTGLLLARVTRIQGKYGQAKRSAEQLLRWTREGGDVARELRATAEAVLIFAAGGPIESAISHLERCREILGGGEDWRGLAGHVARAEAVVAAAEQRLSDATAWFERATTIYRHYSLPWEEAETLLFWGRALLDAGERSSADQKFDSALEIYGRVGAGQTWVDRAVAEKARATDANKTPISAAENVFRKDGDFWTISYGDKTFRLRNLKGLEYIAYLLAHPGVRIHARDLMAMVEGCSHHDPGASEGVAHAEGLATTSDLGDAGEVLDAQAVSSYRRRLMELRAELAEAERNNDLGAMERARREFEELSSQLAAGVGRRGRARRSSSHLERARAAVTKNIRAGVERIRHNDAKLGEHFAASIRTGAFCAYLPDLKGNLPWRT